MKHPREWSRARVPFLPPLIIMGRAAAADSPTPGHPGRYRIGSPHYMIATFNQY
jgi:hypothetical protein